MPELILCTCRILRLPQSFAHKPTWPRPGVRVAVIRERNRGGFYQFLLSLKSVVRLFLSTQNEEITDDLHNVRLFGAAGYGAHSGPAVA